MKIEKIKIFAPAIILLLTLGLIGYFVNHTLQHTGTLVYPLDDTYIHMTLAKNFATNFVWGVSSGQFSSSTSSPLYTLILSFCYMLFGVNDLVPFIINIVFAIFLIYGIWRLFLKQLSFLNQIVILFCVSFFTPIYALVLSGMEHTLHIVLVVLFMYLMNLLVNKQLNTGDKRYYLLFVVIALLGIARYESMFMIIFTSFILVIVKEYKNALLTVFYGFSPIVIYGIISKYNGEMFWPNSIIAKSKVSVSTLDDLVGKLSTLYQNFFIDAIYLGFMFILILLGIVIHLLGNNDNNTSFKQFIKSYYIQLLTLSSIIAHLSFGALNWYFRYESYLITMAFIAIIPLVIFVNKLWLNKAYIKLFVFISIMFVSILPLTSRFYRSLYSSRIATINIYQQQVQMARFVNKYYRQANVALNDIGAVTFYNEIKLLDLFGLADSKVLMAKRTGPWKPLYTRLTEQNDINIAIIYDSWYSNSIIPDSWVKVGEWEINNNVICGDAVVSFYAVGDSNYNILVQNFKAFTAELDSNVIVRSY